jgi:hypothetical protein
MERMALKTIRAINLEDLHMNFNQLPRDPDGPHFTILVLQSPYVVFHPPIDSLLVGMVTIQTRRVIPQHDI